MKKISLGAMVLFITLLTALAPVNAKPIQIEIRTLPKVLHKYLGKKITTHGCFVKNHHGDILRPCGSKGWREVTLVYDPTNKIVSSAFRNPAVIYSNDIEADFTGTLVELDISWPKPEKRIFLRLESIKKATVYVP